jgi:hypothetical protein
MACLRWTSAMLDAATLHALYQAPFEEFVSQRDALAKQLRAEKRKDDAALIKALRKPSRMAWMLNRVVGEDPDALQRLDAAIAEAQTASDLRSALETVKEAVRAVAALAARIGMRAGHPVEPNAIGAAVHAIIGDANAFAELRAGRLVDVPEGGGLDLLTALKPNPSLAKATHAAKAPGKTPAKAPHRAPAPPKEDPRVALAASARADLRRAEKALDAAREKLEQETTSLSEIQASVEAAEQALSRAQSELEARRKEAARTQRHADSAAENLEEAQRAFDKARAHLATFE